MARNNLATDSNARIRLQLEMLEDRAVPSATPVDMLTRGAIGQVGDVIFRQTNAQPTGTGVVNSFLRLQAQGSEMVEQGYNSDYQPTEFDEKTSAPSLRAVRLSEIPLVNLGGINYREFILDVNESSSQPYISLDELRIYTADVANLHGYDAETGQLGGQTPVYDLDAEGDHVIRMNYRLNSGSGSGDVLIYVPDSALNTGDDPYIYFYAKFGVTLGAQAGFEEIGFSSQAITGLGSISGTVYEDANQNQVYDDTEGPLAGWTVYLDANGNDQFDEGEVFTLTNDLGEYTFDNLAVGLGDLSTYRVRQVVDEGWTQSTENPEDIELTFAGQTIEDVDFGNFMIFEE